MTVLGIDPGPVQTALVWFDGQSITSEICRNDEALDRMDYYSLPDVIAIERIASYGMPVGEEVFQTCFWIGRFWEVAKQSGSFVKLVKRIEVKTHVCHDSRAKDANVRQALIDRFGPPGTKKNPGLTYGLKKDLWAALAVAVTVYDKLIE